MAIDYPSPARDKYFADRGWTVESWGSGTCAKDSPCKIRHVDGRVIEGYEARLMHYGEHECRGLNNGDGYPKFLEREGRSVRIDRLDPAKAVCHDAFKATIIIKGYDWSSNYSRLSEEEAVERLFESFNTPSLVLSGPGWYESLPFRREHNIPTAPGFYSLIED